MGVNEREFCGQPYNRSDTGEVVRVMSGLGDVWIVGTVRHTGGKKRLKSRALPPCDNAWDCQANLDAYAEKKGWQPAAGICKHRFYAKHYPKPLIGTVRKYAHCELLRHTINCRAGRPDELSGGFWVKDELCVGLESETCPARIDRRGR